MPFECEYYPSVLKCNNDSSIIICQNNNYCLFNIYKHYVSSIVERLIWIGFHKNDENKKCLINKLPKDLILYILHLLGKRPSMVTPCIKVDI